MNNLPQFFIASPWGGYGNHLRWLLLLDPRFSFKIIEFKINEEQFKYRQSVIGQDLASKHVSTYSEFISLDIDSMEKNLLKEYINCYDLPYLDFTTIEKKIESFEKYVYPKTRSWHNWLYHEWRFRTNLDSYINFSHWPRQVQSNEKIIITSPDNLYSVYKAYLKFNSNLNNRSKDQIFSLVKDFVKEAKILSSDPRYCLISSESLLTPILNKEVYQRVIDHFGFSDCYEQANYVHRIWYNLQKKAETDLIKDLTKIYKD